MNSSTRQATLRRLVLAGLVLAGLWAGAAPLRASPALRQEMTELAKSLKATLDNRGEDTVAMGQFVGPPQLAASGGPLLAKLLAEELTKLKVNVRLRAKLGIKGEFEDVINANDD